MTPLATYLIGVGVAWFSCGIACDHKPKWGDYVLAGWIGMLWPLSLVVLAVTALLYCLVQTGAKIRAYLQEQRS